jgi:hypothetical protein
MIQYLPSLAGVALLSFAFTKLLIPLSHSTGLIDRPDSRKQQSLGGRTPDWVYYEAVERMAAYMNWKALIARSKFWGPLLTEINLSTSSEPFNKSENKKLRNLETRIL